MSADQRVALDITTAAIDDIAWLQQMSRQADRVVFTNLCLCLCFMHVWRCCRNPAPPSNSGRESISVLLEITDRGAVARGECRLVVRELVDVVELVE